LKDVFRRLIALSLAVVSPRTGYIDVVCFRISVTDSAKRNEII